MSLEQLWAGWRHEYVTDATGAARGGEPGGCVFCRIAASGPPGSDNLVLYRDEVTLAVLNLYPYASGHLLVLPIRHVSSLDELTPGESAALWETTRTAAAAVTEAYHPDALNLGANLGSAAGAGIPGHLHLHVVPRWSGDTNFMTSVAGVRVLPQSLPDVWKVVTEAWPR